MLAHLCRYSASRLTRRAGFILPSVRAVQTSAKEKKSSSPAPERTTQSSKPTTPRIIPGFEPKTVTRLDETQLTNDEWRACSFNRKVNGY